MSSKYEVNDSPFKCDVSFAAWNALHEIANAHALIKFIDEEDLDDDSQQDVINLKSCLVEAMASIAINDYIARTKGVEK